MKRTLLVLALAVGLAACSTVPTNGTTPAQAVFAVKSGYATALTAAVAYKNLPACTAVQKAPCSEPSLVAQLQKADTSAYAALQAAESAARTPLVGATATAKALSAAQAALGALTALVTNLQVTK